METIPHGNMAKTPKIPVYLLILLLALTGCRLPHRAAAQAPAAEARLLLQIKRAWGDPTVLAAWNDTSPGAHCDWPYVTCDGARRVTNLSLANTNVAGPVPDAVGELTSLTHLDLLNNSINGSFPTSVYRCASLMYLDLSQNYLGGELPADIGVGLAENLTTLRLNGNSFIGTIPKSLSKLQKLEWLTLDNNNLTGTIPAELGDLTNLRKLTVGTNKFEPAELPASFKSLTKLTYLSVTECKLVGNIPGYVVADMPELETLDLAVNHFAGSIPPGIWSMKKLKHLFLFSNNLTGDVVIDGAIGAVNLVTIDLSSNHKLSGPIPEGFGDLQKLELLNLYYNSFSGEIPASIGRLPSLKTIKLFDNSFTGVLPPELGQKSKELSDVELDNNMFTGSIPEGLCENGKLQAFTAGNNLMNGSIPKRLAGCSTLFSIVLSNNQLSGEVPEALWTATKLAYAKLENNRLTGNLPATMYRNLGILTLENNQFSGSIPAAAAALYKFTAGNNNFSGEIPASLGNGMPMLQNLNLSGNQLSGGIPKSFAKFKDLSQLDLSRNQLSGEIPAELGAAPVLNALDLSSNKLSGDIPPTLAKPNLSSLNLSSNQLGGQVPAALATATYERSFLDNPNLCTSGLGSSELAGMRSCAARWGSPAGASSGGVSPGLRAGLLAAGAALLLVIVGLAFFAVRDIKRRKRATARRENWKVTPFQPDLGFSEAAVLRGLTEENLVGRGGSGSVYRVAYTNRYTGADGAVAVKKIRASAAGKVESEFESEASILGNVRHVNIVRLLCCVSGPEAKLLVYDYMDNGSLDGWLHHGRRDGAINAVAVAVARARSARGGAAPALDWPTRLRVAVGAAQGLHYMHHECTPPIVHRDVKTSNILLDSEFRAKVADFGLARMLAQAGTPDTMSAVAGSFGYMAPECAYTRKVDEKVDVYSFGVVLLELTTGKTANDGGEHGCLADWARHHYQSRGSIPDATDPCIRYAGYSDEIEVVFRLGVMCTGATPSSRPTMKDVLQILVRCSEQTHLKCKADSGQEYEAAPLLLPQRGSRRKQLSNAKGADDDSDERSDFDSIV